MPRLVEFYNQRRLHLDDWISDRIRLADINQGFANMKAGKVVRSVIQFDA
jgi:S-(hydroxymethyl)glutathione dehydrogenase/alcohol dehydrogenase